MGTHYAKQIYPSKNISLGSGTTGYPKSGFMALHFTYPDTEYGDDITTWQYGVNTSTWKQGLQVIVKTAFADPTISLASDTTNLVGVDLAAAATASSKNFDLGTERATRYIAAKINAHQAQQISITGETRLLKARYVRMSSRPSWATDAPIQISATQIVVKFTEHSLLGSRHFERGYPSDLPQAGTIVVLVSGSATTYNYTAIEEYNNKGYAILTVTSLPSYSSTKVPTNWTTATITGEPEKHTIVLSWNKNYVSTSPAITSATTGATNTHWSPANLGPVVQGIGSIPLWKLIAKPMDGGNMALPATNSLYKGGGGKTVSWAYGGYNRFSIEGLNSCYSPAVPAPDYNITEPTIEGVTKAGQSSVGGSSHTLELGDIEYGSNLRVDHTITNINYDNGYSSALAVTKINDFSSTNEFTSHVTTSNGARDYGLKADNGIFYARPFRLTSTLNTNTVEDMIITNEEMVFEDIGVIDEQGQSLILNGGSPFGTVIKDFVVKTERIQKDSTDKTTLPSSPNGLFEPNMEIQLPKDEDIPGEIFVRAGHDRVQAWSNKSWGMGGLSAPNPRPAGVAESSNQASQFDTHDRMLIFHCKRIKDMTFNQTVDGLDYSGDNIYSATPSGTTRIFTAHKASDHAERGAVLNQTTNGTTTLTKYPHHRIRFGRQGHTFVTPIGHRGTPIAYRRQLHRSFGSSYSLMFEAKTEHKHFGFGNGEATNSTTRFNLDTLETKGVSGYTTNAGSFSGDGLPTNEHLVGSRLHHHKAHYSSIAPRTNLDYLIAPGQTQTKVEGTPQKVSQGTLVETTISTKKYPTHLTLTDALSLTNRANTASEFMVNGFLLGEPTMMGGRPEPPVVNIASSSKWFVRGLSEGAIVPRAATELATVPPLILHDPDLLNMAAVPIWVSGTTYTVADKPTDMGLMKETDTKSGATPDAFLCSWLAEYSHPALLGTSREQYLTLRYREAGMPRSTNYPATNGLFLRNHSPQTTAGLAVNADPFETLYVTQWKQNYGFNGLNAAGHGTIEGIRSAGSVLMGHTGLAEPEGTMQILDPIENRFGVANMRKTRGEGIGDGLDPNQDGARLIVDTDTDGVATTKINYLVNPLTAINYSRHLPVRGWGIRGGSDALNMLAGTPTETTASMESIFGNGRFDGGKADCMNQIPDATTHGSQWMTPTEKAFHAPQSLPIGVVMSGDTAEAHRFSNAIRRSNSPILSSDEQMGIGRKLGLQSFGLTNPTALASGHWDLKEDEVRPSQLPVSNSVLWLKADSLDLQDGEAVTSWADATGNGRTFVQGTASAQPKFIASDGDFNDHPVVDCDGGDKLAMASFDAALNTNEFTLFVVAASDTDGGSHQGIIESRSASPVTRSGFNLYAKWSGTNQWSYWWGGNTGWGQMNSSTTLTLSKPDIVTATMSGGDGAGATATQTLRINGAQEATGTSAFWKSTADPAQVGVVPSSFYLNGQIAEVIQYDRVLTTAEVSSVEAYLSLKYAKTLHSSHSHSQSALNMLPQNKGLDPFIDLVQYTGSASYPQTESKAATNVATEAVIGSIQRWTPSADTTNFYTLKGNALHTNAASVASNTTDTHYPITGWGIKNAYAAAPIPLSEITDHRQIQSRGEPRMGLVMEVESERNESKRSEYQITGTKAISLHSDLAIGQQFPVLPAWGNKTSRRYVGMTSGTRAAPTGGALYSTPTVSMSHEKPFWSPDSNKLKGAITVSNDTVRIDAQTHGMDYWSVRGSADLPSWGGVYILRKTYMNRDEESGNNETTVDGSSLAQSHQPQRKYIDYVVRLVRPLKMYGWASNLQSDGWVLGANASTTNSGGLGFQPFTRDKRYGVFEINDSKALGSIEVLSSANGALEIEWPDANEQSAVFHLIPSANMLQHFKSDAHRKLEGTWNAEIEARYSQSTHSGGKETLYQSESDYEIDGTGNAGDYAKRNSEYKLEQQDTMLRDYPSVIAKQTFNGGGATTRTYLLDQAVSLPSSGSLSVMGKTNKLTYTSVSGRMIKGVNNLIVDYVHGDILYLNDGSTGLQTYANKISMTPALPTAPSFVDNAIVLNKVTETVWRRYNSTLDKISKTSLTYRGLLEYSPADFIMASQRPLLLTDGHNGGVVSEPSRSSIQIDGQDTDGAFFPPYIFDSGGKMWRVAGIDKSSKVITLRNMGDELISKVVSIGEVLTGQHGYIGIRTSDAALNLLNDAAGNVQGFLPAPSASLLGASMKTSNTLGANPALRLMKNHSGEYVSRQIKGLNILDVIKSLTEMDGRQLVLENNGMMIYSSKVFNESNIKIGLDSGAQDIQVSKMFDSPNQVIVVGDVVADNEQVQVTVKDLEKMKNASGGGSNNLVRTLRKEIPGLKTNKEALRVAKALLSRAENGAPLITINGLLKASSITPGDIININLPTHGVRGSFGVFEATNIQSTGQTNLIVAQYEKGIEGLLSDIQTATGNSSSTQNQANKKNELTEIALTGSVKIIAVAKVYMRINNKQKFIIGAKYDGGLGKIGVRDSNKRAKPLGQSKSRFFEVK
tara:strand:+ start:11458 stop:18990 length:7533 start_codon:yes stop_codon:yes gene_type:complete